MVCMVAALVLAACKPAPPPPAPTPKAPTTPLVLASEASDASESGKRVGLLRLSKSSTVGDDFPELAAVETLSDDGDLRIAAAEFFAALRRLDSSGLDLILAESFPEEGLGRALNDRLRRACHQ